MIYMNNKTNKNRNSDGNNNNQGKDLIKTYIQDILEKYKIIIK